MLLHLRMDGLEPYNVAPAPERCPPRCQ